MFLRGRSGEEGPRKWSPPYTTHLSREMVRMVLGVISTIIYGANWGVEAWCIRVIWSGWVGGQHHDRQPAEACAAPRREGGTCLLLCL